MERREGRQCRAIIADDLRFGRKPNKTDPSLCECCVEEEEECDLCVERIVCPTHGS